MTIRSSVTDRSAVLRMAGTMSAGDFAHLHTHLVSLLRTRRTEIVLDFNGVDHISYRSAARLADEFELVRSYDANLRIAGISPYVRNILLLAGLHGFLEMNTFDSAAVMEPAPAHMPLAS